MSRSASIKLPHTCSLEVSVAAHRGISERKMERVVSRKKGADSAERTGRIFRSALSLSLRSLISQTLDQKFGGKKQMLSCFSRRLPLRHANLIQNPKSIKVDSLIRMVSAPVNHTGRKEAISAWEKVWITRFASPRVFRKKKRSLPNRRIIGNRRGGIKGFAPAGFCDVKGVVLSPSVTMSRIKGRLVSPLTFFDAASYFGPFGRSLSGYQFRGF